MAGNGKSKMTERLYNCVIQYLTPGGHKVTARAKSIACDAEGALLIGEKIIRRHKLRRIGRIISRQAIEAVEYHK